jgi:hypothetical protein
VKTILLKQLWIFNFILPAMRDLPQLQFQSPVFNRAGFYFHPEQAEDQRDENRRAATPQTHAYDSHGKPLSVS